MTAYYNEIEPFAADWLRNLISAGLIAPGEVDTRSIKDVSAADVRGFTQCHFFAGIGGWSAALRLAGWPDDCPAWSGSCPCQPFSAAGKRKGTKDERHLWPEFRRLIGECAPSVVFGEQVASKDGRKWLTGVRLDLEALGYGVGAADLCAAGTAAPHIRQRLWWVADASRAERGRRTESERERRPQIHAADGGESCALGIAAGQRDRTPADAGSDCEGEGEGRQRGAGGSGASGIVGKPDSRGRGEIEAVSRCAATERGISGTSGFMGDATASGRSRSNGTWEQEQGSGTGCTLSWSDFSIVPCLDGKARRIEPSAFPLVDGIPRDMGSGRSKLERVAIRAARANRTGRLKGYGNAIVPELAAEFIAAFMESVECS